MSTRQFFPVLLTALLVSAAIALLFSGGVDPQPNMTADSAPPPSSSADQPARLEVAVREQ